MLRELSSAVFQVCLYGWAGSRVSENQIKQRIALLCADLGGAESPAARCLNYFRVFIIMPPKTTPEDADFIAGFNKVVHNIPYDQELEAMTFAQLSVALEQSKQGSARHSVIALEMEKRKSSSTETNNGWIHRNGGNLIVGVLASLLAAALWFYYGLR